MNFFDSKTEIVSKRYNEQVNDSIREKAASKPYCVETKYGKFFYYLNAILKNKEACSKIVWDCHECRQCKDNMEKIGGLMGEDMEWAVNVSEHEIYKNYRREIDDFSVFMVCSDTLNEIPRFMGQDKVTHVAWEHIHLNVHSLHKTLRSCAVKFPRSLLKSLTNGSMDGRLQELIDVLSCKNGCEKTELEIMFETLDSAKLLRKGYWIPILNYAKSIVEFADSCSRDSGITERRKWEHTDNASKMHIRVFALCSGDGSHTSEVNTLFQQIHQLIDCSKNVEPGKLINYMNARTDPQTMGVSAMTAAMAKNKVESRFQALLYWKGKTDLDVHCVIRSTGEHIYFGNKYSNDKQTFLNFDENASSSSAVVEAVECITLSSKKPDRYGIYVNNYITRNSQGGGIPFNVSMRCDGDDLQQYPLIYTIRDYTGHDVNYMKYIADIEITQELIDMKQTVTMSDKQANRFGALYGEYREHFGEVKSKLVDVNELNNVCKISVRSGDDSSGGALDFMQMLADKKKNANKTQGRTTMGQRNGLDITSVSDLLNAVKSGRVSHVSLNAREYSPTYVTKPICKNPDVLRNKLVFSGFYEKGAISRKIDPDVSDVVCKYDEAWCVGTKPQVNAIAKIEQGHTSNGYFMSLDGAKIPDHQDWIIGAGLYTSDLNPEYHKFRDIYGTSNALVQPKFEGNEPAIGIFMHSGKSYPLIIDGVEKYITA